ncbi:MAG: hypothetical protein AAGF95_24960 [Chloroflexota bacterium]
MDIRKPYVLGIIVMGFIVLGGFLFINVFSQQTGNHEGTIDAADGQGNAPILPAPPTPTPVMVPTTVPTPERLAVRSITLINADADQPFEGFDPLLDGSTIRLSELSTQDINIRANTTEDVLSVDMVLLGATRKQQDQNALPYSLFGDEGDNYRDGELNPGDHVLVIIPYSGDDTDGESGKPFVVTFTVVE